jgi:hypothetical protein
MAGVSFEFLGAQHDVSDTCNPIRPIRAPTSSVETPGCAVRATPDSRGRGNRRCAALTILDRPP